ncbi:hypothetical protein AB0B83_05255 [Micromonospora sp. NPDC049060]|uniref:hypothetical protein n=1 Tax=Micromonospora sp. NPDC049060 TaxID=3154828 RepID=UPI003405CD91
MGPTLADDWQLALTLEHLAAALVDAGRPEEARRWGREAVALLARLPDARAASLRTRIAQSLRTEFR